MALTSFSRLITELAMSDSDAPAVTCGNQSISRIELDKQSNRLARAYQRLGVKEGDFVTIALPNAIEFFLSTVAIWKLGATPQPVSPRLPKKELLAIIELANPALIVGVEPQWFSERRVLPIGFEADTLLSDKNLADVTSRYWKAPTSGGSTGQPKLIVSEMPAALDPNELSGLRILANRVHSRSPLS